MRTNRDFWRGAALAALVMLTIGATVTTKYRGQFAGTFHGLGSGITNASGQYFGTTNGYVGSEITNNCATITYARSLTNDYLTISRFTNENYFSAGLSGLTNTAAEDTGTSTNTFGFWVLFTNVANGAVYKIRAYPDR